MFKKISIGIVLLMFFVLVSAVSAEDANMTDLESSIEGDFVVESTLDDAMGSNSHTVSAKNYLNYFDSKGNFIDSTADSGDTIYLDGSFSDMKFTFDKPVNVVGTSTNNMKNAVVTFLSGASGSSIANLNIANNKANTIGIFLNGANGCSIQNCVINNTGMASHCIAVANGANYNNITDNNVACYGITYGHGGTRSTTPLIVSGSNYNYIAGNKVEVDDANGIYLSSYNHDPLKGGISNFNIIYNNTVHYNVLPTSWAYGIQVMGENNTIRFNKVIGGYRGISTSSGNNNAILDNTIINLTGADYNHLGVEVGGEYAIVGTPHSIIANNTVVNAKIIGTGAAISVIDNSIAENNIVNVTKSGKGIDAGGSNVVVRNNIIFTESGSGVHEKDEGSGLLVENNTITSKTGVGVLIEKLSSKRMPSNVTVIGNTISTTNKNAIEASGVQANSSVIDLKSNKIIGSGNIVSPAGVFDTSKPTYLFDGKTHIITPENIRDYINENGGLSPEISDGDIISFEGTFTNEIIFITKSVKITGKNPIFHNSSIKITASSVYIENLTIINKEANRVNAWGIFVNQASGVKITNNNIQVNDPKASYAIYVLESSEVEVVNNRLASEGTYLTFTLLSYASENCEFRDNTISTVGTDEVHAYEPKKCLDGEEACLDGNEFCLDGGHIVPEIYRTYGILMLYSSNNKVSNNNVNVTSRLKDNYPTTGANSSTNSLVGIDLYYNSHNNVFTNNNVFVKGMDNYIYGMGVLGIVTGHTAPEGQGASNNKFIGNRITLEGNYFATGIIAGEGSFDTSMVNNTVDAKSKGVVYGITLEMSQRSDIQSNDLRLGSPVIYGIDFISSSGNSIKDNDVRADGKTVCSVLFSNANNNNVSGNLIVSNGSGEELGFVNLDFISCKNSGIYLTANSTGNDIFKNNISSNVGYAILLDDEAVGNLIHDNYLISKEGKGNDAVNKIDKGIFDNYADMVDASFNSLSVPYLGTGEFIFNFTGDADGGIVKLYDVDGNYLTEDKVTGNTVNLKYEFDDSYIPSQYLFTAEFRKNNFKTETYDVNFEVVKGQICIDLKNVTIAQGDTKEIVAKVFDGFENPIGNVNVQFYRKNSVGNIRSIGTAVTDKDGIAGLNYTVQSSLSEGNHEIFAEVQDLDCYNGANQSATLTVLERLDLSIVINSNVYYGGVLATLKDSKNNAVADKKVTVKIGDDSYSLVSNSNGEIMLPQNVMKGSYQVDVASDAQGKYLEASGSSKTTVLPLISGNKDYSRYYGNTISYKVSVVGSDGNPVNDGEIVVIKVGSAVYEVSTKNGYATKSLKGLKTGTYTVTSAYKGDDVTNKITIKPTLIAKDLSKKKAKTVKFTVKLVNKNGKILKNKKITFKIKNKKYTAKTNKKGIATLSLKNLKVGKYTIKSSYGGCTISNKITIKK